MIRYHGGPITPLSVARDVWSTRHAMVSFAWPEQIALAAECAHSFTIDNGAFTAWKSGEAYDFDGYAEFIARWGSHPGCDWYIIPDKIDGTEDENDQMIADWWKKTSSDLVCAQGVPVWHMHESIDRLEALSHSSQTVALGSSGEFATPGSDSWWRRMCEAMEAICIDGVPTVRLHGLRMMNPTLFSHIPFASVDSTNVAQNASADKRWTGAYAPTSDSMRALVLADRMERHASAARWSGSKGVQMNFELCG